MSFPLKESTTPSVYRKWYWTCLLIGWLGLGSAAHGQTDLERFERQLEQIRRETRLMIDTTLPVEQRTLLDYGGYATFSFLAIDDLDQSTHILRQTDVNTYLRLNVDGVHEFFLRVRTSYLDFNSGDAFDSHGDDWVGPTLDRGHYRFDLARYYGAYKGETLPYNFVLQGGRQLVHWANGVTLSQELDGGVMDFSHDRYGLQVVAGMTRQSSTDIDSSRPAFTNSMKRIFSGGLLSAQVTATHKPFVYGLVQQDRNDENSATVGGIDTNFDYESWYVGTGSTGNIGDRLLYGVELVYQGGETLSDPIVVQPQTKDDIQAFAGDFKLDFLVSDANKSRFTVEVLVATGDDDRSLHTTNTFGGNAPGTDDHSFNAFGLINTGLAFSPNVSNLILLRGGASTFPLPNSEWFKQLQVGTNLFVFNKFDDDAPIDELTSDQTYLGFESDFYANWQITSDLSLGMRYGVFFPGQAITTDKDPRHFFFTGITYAY